MRLIANCQLRGEYGQVVPDQEFEARDEIAVELIARGNARHARPPKIQYETKIITPVAPVVSAREPFRDGAVSNAQPKVVDTEGHRVLSTADLSDSGAADTRGRGRRTGSDSK